MKLFDFVCQTCECTFEELASNDEVIACPTCNKPAERIFGMNPTAPHNAKMKELFNHFADRKALYKGVSKEGMPYVGKKKVR
jgi:putative FmdB family regulatory protein